MKKTTINNISINAKFCLCESVRIETLFLFIYSLFFAFKLCETKDTCVYVQEN